MDSLTSVLPQQIGRRTRYKASKSESVIKPGRQDGKLLIYQRKCAYGECDDCGIKKYFSGYIFIIFFFSVSFGMGR